MHGTTHEIPFDRLPQENLRPFSSYPPYIFQKNYQRKVSRDCYLSLYGNLYSVPWRYAGRYVDVVVRNTTMLIVADGTELCSHPLLEGRNQRSRRSEHFEGLLNRILAEPCRSPKKNQVPQLRTEEYSVEERNLAVYDTLFEEGYS